MINHIKINNNELADTKNLFNVSVTKSKNFLINLNILKLMSIFSKYNSFYIK